MIASEKEIQTGMVALVGPPNVGKSTLLNTLLGQKISIVSPKPQTTRNRIMGIVNDDDYQIILLDTPGIHAAHSPLNQSLVRAALDSLAEVEVIVFMIDVTYPLPERLAESGRVLQRTGKPVILIINKIDLVEKDELLPIIQAYQAIHPFQAILPISALHNDGCQELISELLPLLPKGPRIFPEDIPTDVSERFIVSEMIREKIFLLTHQEIPYATAVTIDAFQEGSRQVTIHATINVERSSQKGIIIGKGGKMLARIGREARFDIQELLGAKVVLKLWVKVVKEWSRRAASLRDFGY
ncbi:MAG: GTPase Era [Thermodesulfobacteriota bacterium]